MPRMPRMPGPRPHPQSRYSVSSVVIHSHLMSEPRTASSKKGPPFSIRLSRATDRVVQAEAKRTKRSKSAVVEAFTEETARARRFPGVGFRGDDASRRAWVLGSGLDVWEIAHMLEDFGSIRKLVAETHLTEGQVRLALAYRDEYPEEIEELLEENRRPLEELRTLYPFVLVDRARP
jgi:uncharacterized protein (DUF433 family)